MHEAQMHKENCFLTLTYRDDALSYGNTQATLYKKDLQDFWKRLRKKVNHEIRYFACGEYGELGCRPHYHACLFGFDFPDKTILRSEAGNNLYSSHMLDNVWSNGHCSVGALTVNSAAYVARYILDKRLGNEKSFYEDKGIEPEFVVMSRGSAKRGTGGIGKAWYDRYSSDIYPWDRVVLDDGSTARPPRYYDELRKLQNPQEMEKIKIERIEKAENREYSEKSAIRMMNKIRFHENRAKNISKKLHR